MIVQCPSCAAKFRVADDKVTPKGVKVRCGRCKTVFRVRRAGADEARPAAGLRRAPAPTDEEATRVVHDPVGEALEELPADVGNPLFRTGESPRGVGADLDEHEGDDWDDGDEESPGADRVTGFVATHHGAGEHAASRQSGGEAPEAQGTLGRPDWLITGSAGDYVQGHDDASKAAPAFQPPVTDEHPPRGAPGSGGLRFEPPVDLGLDRAPRRDALASLADPMPAADLEWDVEGDTAPRPRGVSPTPRAPEPAPSRPAPPAEPSPEAAEARAALGEVPPSPAPAVAESGGHDVMSDAYTFSHRPVTRGERVAVWLGMILGAVLVAVAFFVFLAAKNDWLLDLKAMDQMMGVAFAGETYQPRVVRTVRVYDLEGQRVEEPTDEAVQAPGLEVGNLEQGVYDTGANEHLLLVEGDLLNHDTQPHRAVFVVGRLLQGDVEVGRVVAPVGRTLTQEELEALATPQDLDAVYATVAEEAAPLVIQPGQRSRFSLVFPDREGDVGGDALSYTIEVARTDRPTSDGGWERVVYDPEAAGTPAP